MTTVPQAHPHGRFHVNPWLVAVTVLGVAVVVLGTWVIADRYTGGGPTQDATRLLDEWYSAASTSDAEAATALWAPNGVLWMNDSKLVGAQAIAGDIGIPHGLRIERVAPVVVDGDLATTFVRFTAANAGIKDVPVADVYQLKGGKILRQWSFILGETPPFDNVARP